MVLRYEKNILAVLFYLIDICIYVFTTIFILFDMVTEGYELFIVSIGRLRMNYGIIDTGIDINLYYVYLMVPFYVCHVVGICDLKKVYLNLLLSWSILFHI